MFKLQCECGNRIAVRSKHAGKIIHCIKCKREIKVPDASASARMIGVPRASVDAKVWNAGPQRRPDPPAAPREPDAASAPAAAPATRAEGPTAMSAPSHPLASPKDKADGLGGSLQFAPLFPVESAKPAKQGVAPRQAEQPVAPSSAPATAREHPAAESCGEVGAGLFSGGDQRIREAEGEAASNEVAGAAGTAGGPRSEGSAMVGADARAVAGHAVSMSWFDLPEAAPPSGSSEAKPAKPGSTPAEASTAAAAAPVRAPLAQPTRKPAPAANTAALARLQLDGYLHQAAVDRRYRRTRRLMLAVRLMIAVAVLVAVVVGVMLVGKTLLRARAGGADAVTFVLVNQSVAGSRAASLTVHLAFPGLERDSYVLLEGDLDRLAKAVPPLVIRHPIHHATIPSTSTSVIEDAQGHKRLSKVRYDLTPEEAAMLWQVPSATCVIGAMRFEMTPQTVRQMHWQAQRYGYDIASPGG